MPTWDEDGRNNTWQDWTFKGWDTDDGKTFIDDDLLGFMTAEAAKAEGKSCGVCGEAASDPLLACVLTGLGVTSLSMGAASIPYVRANLAKYTLAQCERAAAAARAADTAEEARGAAQAVLSGE